MTVPCDRCGKPYDFDEKKMTEFVGRPVTLGEYYALTRENESVWFLCAACIIQMPDVHFEGFVKPIADPSQTFN